jgi:hypothetical protein
MDSIEKDYLIDKAMISIASFSSAAKITRAKINNLISQPGTTNMTTEQVLEYLVNFMDEESEKMFNLYDQAFKKKVSRETTYIELIPEAPFNIEDKESTIEILKFLENKNKESFHLYQVFDKDGLPKFITIDDFEKNYYEYWEIVLRKSFGYTEEQIKKFKQGI